MDSLFNFDGKVDGAAIQPQDATFKLETKDKNGYLMVENGFSIKEPGIKLKATKENPWDLEGYYQIKADLTNVGQEFMQVEMFVGNDPDGLV